MKAAAITGEREASIIDMPVPAPSGDVVLVKTLVTPMCTEYKAYAAGRRTTVLGHEAAGEVVEVAQPGRVRVGDRVVVMPQNACGRCWLCLQGEYIHCQHNRNIIKDTGNTTGASTYAQFLLKPDWLLVSIPDDISIEHASMGCCGMGPTFGAMELLNVDTFDTVLITGMGPVGLGGVINGVHRGCRVIAVESHPFRQEMARNLGAFDVIDPASSDAVRQIFDLTEGRGADKGIDCSGSPAARRLLVDAARRKGKLVCIGEGADLTLDVSNDLLRKGLTIMGSWHYNLAGTPRLMRAIRNCVDQIERLITHTFPLAEVQSAFELQLTGACGKVLLHPN